MPKPPLRKQSQPEPAQIHQTIVNVQGPPPSQAIPALANMFCWTGIGQLIQGRVISAMLFSLAEVIAAFSCLIVVGFFMWPLVRILAVIDAAKYNPNNQSSGGALLAIIAFGLIGGVAAIAAVGSLATVGVVADSIADENARPTYSEQSDPSETVTAATKPDATEETRIPVEETPVVVAEPEIVTPDPPLPTTLEGIAEEATRIKKELREMPKTNYDRRRVAWLDRRQVAVLKRLREIMAARKTQDAAAAAETEKKYQFDRKPNETSAFLKQAAKKGWRTWTSTAGTTLEARFASRLGKTVTLEKRDGTKIKLPLDKLSNADQVFIASKQNR